MLTIGSGVAHVAFWIGLFGTISWFLYLWHVQALEEMKRPRHQENDHASE
jgi:hypothetical protein